MLRFHKSVKAHSKANQNGIIRQARNGLSIPPSVLLSIQLSFFVYLGLLILMEIFCILQQSNTDLQKLLWSQGEEYSHVFVTIFL